MDQKPVAKSRTVWVGILFLLGGIANEVAAYLQNLPSDKATSATAIAGGIALIVLRLVSKSEVVFPRKK